MPQPTAVLLVVGLNRSLIGPWSPHLAGFARRGVVRTLQPVLPALTCSVQSSILTGQSPGGPGGHGIVGNGWYDRTRAQVGFWQQSNHLVQGEKIWETARKIDPSITCANLFWWYNMYSSVDYSVTPRPIYKADGRKLPDIYTNPMQLRHELLEQLGTFPLFNFWGPGSSIKSSQWIARAAIFVHQQHRPTLSLVYLPHLDYALQKIGPNHPDIPAAVGQIDRVIGQLIEYFQQQGVRLILLSEYSIEPVDQAIPINRVLREESALCVRDEQGLELLDPGASDGFAVADHQIAHVYIKDRSHIGRFAGLCKQIPGVDLVLDRHAQAEHKIDHPRSGDLLLVAKKGYWFSYEYWLDDSRAPDFARTVDIHRKPGYDPLELFIDPTIGCPRLRLAWKWLGHKLGQRTLFDLIPLDTSLVRGSHGRVDHDPGNAPILITETDITDHPEDISCCDVRDIVLGQLGQGGFR